MAVSVKTFEDLVRAFAPLILSSLGPGAAVYGPLVADAVTAAETLQEGSGHGPAKKASVLATVSDAINVLNSAKGKTVADSSTVVGQVSTGIDLTISIINSIQAYQKATAGS